MQATSKQIAIERPTLDWQEIVAAQCKARVLRAEAFMQFCVVVPGRWLRSRVDAARRAAGAPVATGA